MTLAFVGGNHWDAYYCPCHGGCTTVPLTHPLGFHRVLQVIELTSCVINRISIASTQEEPHNLNSSEHQLNCWGQNTKELKDH